MSILKCPLVCPLLLTLATMSRFLSDRSCLLATKFTKLNQSITTTTVPLSQPGLLPVLRTAAELLIRFSQGLISKIPNIKFMLKHSNREANSVLLFPCLEKTIHLINFFSLLDSFLVLTMFIN